MGSGYISCPFVVEKSEVILVKPSKPTPNITLSLSTIDNDPNNECTPQTVCVFGPKPYLGVQFNLGSLFQHALSNALFYYYPLSGKVHRRSDDQRLQIIYTTSDGVPFWEAKASCTLSSQNYFEGANNLAEAYELVPSLDALKDSTFGYKPLALQVTQFACGGMTIGITYSHSVCDGIGMTQFIMAVIELAFGSTQPTVIPVWDRDRLTCNDIDGMLENVNDDRNPKVVGLEKASYYPYTPTEDMVREILNITSDDITKLKKLTMGNEQVTNIKENSEVITTMEVVAGYVWRARCRAMTLCSDKTVSLGITVNIRNTFEPPLPKGYYGNAIVRGYVTMTAKELREMPMAHIVKRIKEAKRAGVDNGYVWEQLRELERTMKLKLESKEETQGGASMRVTDWRHLGQGHAGWEGIVNIISLISFTRSVLCVLLPVSKADPRMSGGIRVLVALPKDVMAKFKEEMDALNP